MIVFLTIKVRQLSFPVIIEKRRKIGSYEFNSHICDLMMSKNYKKHILDLWSKYKEYNMTVLTFKNDKTIQKRLIPRQANIPEIISQYFVYKILKNKLQKNVTLNNTPSSADLLIDLQFVEIKAGINGPSTLTTQEK